MSVKENSQKIEQLLDVSLAKSSRKRSDVQVIAVTKSVSSEQAVEAIEEGYLHLAENRPEGLALKQKELSDHRLVWHFIGNLQARKVKKVINDIDYFHALDRLSLAEEIEKEQIKLFCVLFRLTLQGRNQKWR